MCQKKIDSVEAFIKKTKSDYTKWGLGEAPWFPWFRGEPDCDTPLVPKLYRKKYQNDYFENRLLQHFRTRATAYGETPHRDETDLWLFLARHVGLPTRLLDWTESSLATLYFSLVLKEEKSVVWMLNPFKLNNIALCQDPNKDEYNIYGLTWYQPKGWTNIASANINAAWQDEEGAIEMPVAIAPTYIHPRIPAQRGRFTVHGTKKEGLDKLLYKTNVLQIYSNKLQKLQKNKQNVTEIQKVQDGLECVSKEYSEQEVLQKYVIDGSKKKEMLKQLKILGISRATLFPDLEGLAQDLTELFRPDLAEGGK